MKIYDCFSFFNEFETLEIRLNELYKYVDYFVLVEANTTYSGIKKPFIFEKNKERFAKWEDKIIYVKVENMPHVNKFGEFLQKIFGKLDRYVPLPLNGLAIHLSLGRRKLVDFQRNQIIRGLYNCKNEDIILISDLDEIPDPRKFKLMKEKLDKSYKRVIFKNKYFCYYLNGFLHDNWNGTRACKFQTLKKYFNSKPGKVKRGIRDSQFLNQFFNVQDKIYFISDGGWHFTYIGGKDKILLKISSLAAAQRDNKSYNNENRIKKLLEERRFLIDPNQKINYIKMDKSFPLYIRKNINKYGHLLK